MTSGIAGLVLRSRRRTSWLFALAVPLAGCASVVEVGVETPLESKLDMTRFKRVLVAGFVTEANVAEVDAAAETVRLLQNQLRTNTKLRVLEADQPPIEDALEKQQLRQAGLESATKAERERRAADADRLLGDQEFWKRIGEEYQQPLIISGRVGLETRERAGFGVEEQQAADPYTEMQRARDRRYSEQVGYSLSVEFVFIDGRTGRALHREKFTEEVLYSDAQKVAALSAYFELMDRLLPNVLGVISTQRIRGTRFLLP
jgi:hypothetical protein